MIASFAELALRPELQRAVTELGFETPTPIQAAAIPALLEGRDLFGQAQTGTGKTAAFALPILHQIDFQRREVQAIFLAPTRELAMQVAEAVLNYGKYLGVRALAIYGGSSYTRQLKKLSEGVHVVVGTPGRVIDLLNRGALDLSNVRFVVLDEADEMLNMGFIEDVETILRATPEDRQTAMFSATLPASVRTLAATYMHQPETVVMAQKTLTVPQVAQYYMMVYEESKTAVVARILDTEEIGGALVFTRTKLGAAQLAEALIARGFPVEAIHGDLNQEAREIVMRRFRNGHVRVLVATDVAARGIDIEGVSHVINVDVPFDPEDYVHRIGRTGRAGRTGSAITLVTPRERRWLYIIENFTKQKLQQMPLPSADLVLERRRARFYEATSQALAEVTDADRAVVSDWVEAGYDPFELAAAALRMARGGDEKPVETINEPRVRPAGEAGPRESRYSRDRSERYGERRGPRRDEGSRRDDGPRRSRSSVGEAGMVTLRLNIGREHGVKPGDVVGAIAGEAGIPGRAIGAINIRQNETYVDVAEAHADRVLNEMKRGTVRGQAVQLRRAE